jgi:hypothetical protein
MKNTHAKRLIHIHIPKTGGTWLNSTLKKYAGDFFLDPEGFGNGNRCNVENPMYWRGRANLPAQQHYDGLRQAPVVLYNDTQMERWEDSLKVSICRNPFDYLVSIYHYDDTAGRHKKYLAPGVPAGTGLINVKHGMKSFEEFIEKFCDDSFPWDENLQNYEMRYNLFWQMFEHDGTCGVDAIIRQEQLSLGTAKLLQTLDVIGADEFDKITASPKENVGANRLKKDYRSYYTDKLREMVEKKCCMELNLFDYNFDGPTTPDVFIGAHRLFYHPVIPIGGKDLSPELMKMYDEGLRRVECDRRAIISAQSITPDFFQQTQAPLPQHLVEEWAGSWGEIKMTDGVAEILIWSPGSSCDIIPMFEDWDGESPSTARSINGNLILCQKSKVSTLIEPIATRNERCHGGRGPWACLTIDEAGRMSSFFHGWEEPSVLPIAPHWWRFNER